MPSLWESDLPCVIGGLQGLRNFRVSGNLVASWGFGGNPMVKNRALVHVEEGEPVIMLRKRCCFVKPRMLPR